MFEQELARNIHDLHITALKPNHNYSCTLLAYELNEDLTQVWTKLIEPVHFLTQNNLTVTGKIASRPLVCIKLIVHETVLSVLLIRVCCSSR